jgi:hypothetical protein
MYRVIESHFALQKNQSNHLPSKNFVIGEIPKRPKSKKSHPNGELILKVLLWHL